MDLRTSFDDEDFFDRYAREQVAVAEFDAAEAQPPTPEQLAHLTRFRKPVAWIVVGLALFSLLALEEHGARRAFLARYGAPRELVAHYRSAIAGPAKAGPAKAGPAKAGPAKRSTSAAEAELFSGTESSSGAAAAQSRSSSAAAFVSLLTSMCLPDCSSELEPDRQNDVAEPWPAPLLDLCLAPGQARDLMAPSAFDDVVESVRAALNAKRSEVAERIASLESALRGYERALEFEIAESFASEHHLKQPARQERAAEAALKLSRAVANLPELAARANAQSSALSPELEREPSSEREASASSKARAHAGKLVIIGALSGREKSGALPAEVALDAEWIDTERDGVHAVGNLPQRIRQGRVSGVVILDRIVSHKHTEPVVAAAREAKVPVAFAGQGGKASLARALAQLAEMRRERG